MEAFSLLKYWRRGGGDGGGSVGASSTTTTTTTTTGTTTIITAVSPHTSGSDSDNDGENDDGPFFDLEFTVQDEDKIMRNYNNDVINSDINNNEEEKEDDEEDDDTDSDASSSDGESDAELKFTLSTGSTGDCTDPNVASLSPSDDMFLPVEPVNDSEPNSKTQFPVSLLRSATKLRVSMLMLKLKKSKSNVSEKSQDTVKSKESKKSENENEGKSFTVKLKIEEVPIMSLFTRENSSKSGCNKANKPNLEENAVSDEKRFSKDVIMQKYLKIVKPLYIRVSKRYGEKLRFSGQLASSEVATTPSENVEVGVAASNVKSLGSLPSVVRKHLGKSRSASSATVPAVPVCSERRDDSLLQQQDGIQGAILHCKRSFHASRDEGN